MSAPEVTEDPELQAVAWDLDPLLDGRADDPDAAVGEMLAEVQRRADAFAEAYAGKVAELDGAGLVAAMRELEAIQELLGRAGSYAILNFSGDTADPARGALLQKLQEGSTRIETAAAVLRARVGRARGRPRRGAARRPTGSTSRATTCETARRYRPHLLSEPEEKILAEKALTGRTAWTRLFEEQASAITVQLEEGAEPGLARGRAQPPVRARPRRPPPRRRARHRGAPARPAHARLRAQHAARRQDGRGPAAPLPALAGQPQPRQRGLRRVGRGAGHRGPRPLRAAAPLVPPQGPPARARLARRLRPHGGRHRRAGARRLGEREGHGAHHLRRLLGRARLARAALLRRVVDRRAGPPQQARRRVLRLHGAQLAPVRAAQLHLHAPRRAHARARARPRRPRRARRAPGRLPHGDPADDGRDRERVRRDARVRPPARAGGHRRSRASRCSPRASRARSPPSSARSR